jgi:hypothetical protein
MTAERAFGLLVDFDAGIAGAALGEYGANRSKTVGVLIENNRTFILDELGGNIQHLPRKMATNKDTLHSLKHL